MDPLGFALENFDAIGTWRTTSEAGSPIDASGTLPDGARFAGPERAARAAVSRREQFVGTMTEKLLTYALGRGLEYYDLPGGAPDRPRRRAERLPLVVADSRHRQERAVSDEDERGRDSRSDAVSATRHGWRASVS